jgi:ABC-type hemin transport system substrate-binding protein
MSRRFRDKFQDVTVPNRKTIHAIINKLRQTGSLLDKKEPIQNAKSSLKRKLVNL